MNWLIDIFTYMPEQSQGLSNMHLIVMNLFHRKTCLIENE